LVIDVQTKLAPTVPAIKGAESEIRDGITNLVLNAIDAMPNGGRLTLVTRTVNGSAAVREVQLEVTDTGVGMDEETRRRCLEPFFSTKGERGTGLGLAMVYGMVQRHAAEIEIESSPGEGTTVRMIFPANTADSADAAPAPFRSDVRPNQRLRLLVIDDDPLLTKSLRDMLENDGHSVTTADGGQAGIDAFQSACDRGEPFSAVMTDLGMPHVDGRKVAAFVKAAAPATPVILLTGWGRRMLDAQDIPLNVDRVLGKPPRLREIREALANSVWVGTNSQSENGKFARAL
jgi:CheY-like chemotaxis protein/anti-sigma regulatory factor (Ser/Thr protein kinase)